MHNNQLNKTLFNLLECIGAIAQEIHDLAPCSSARKGTLFVVPNGIDINEIQALSHYLHEFTGLAYAIKSPISKEHRLIEINRLIDFLGDKNSSYKWVFNMPPFNFLMESLLLPADLRRVIFHKLIIKKISTGAEAGKKNKYGYYCDKGSVSQDCNRQYLLDDLINSVIQVKEALEQSTDSADSTDPNTGTLSFAPEIAELLIIISTINTEIRNYAEWHHQLDGEILCYWEINALSDCVLKICDVAKVLKDESLSADESQAKIKNIVGQLKSYLEKSNENPFALRRTVDRIVDSSAHTYTGVSYKFMIDTNTFKQWPSFIKNILFKLGIGCIHAGTINQAMPINNDSAHAPAPRRLQIPIDAIKALKYIENKIRRANH